GVKTLAQGVSPGSELIAAKSPERATHSAAPSGTPGLPSVAASRRDRRYSEESSVTSRLRPVSFTETVARIRNRKNTVRLRRNLDVIRFPVMFRWRRRVWTWRWGRQRCDGHSLLLLVDQISDEHSSDGVFLAAELRKVNLPHIFDTR